MPISSWRALAQAETEAESGWCDKDGPILAKGSYLDDKLQGTWTFRYRDGFTAEGAYEYGKRIGAWTVRDREGNITTVDYAHDQQ